MYTLDWLERRRPQMAATRAPDAPKVNPIAWKLGFTSFLTDISSEMVNSILPIYLVMHLHMSALQYGAIDGIYNGIAVALLALGGGVMADRTGRYKEVAGFGYGLSAGCKVLLLAAGGAWGSIAGIIALDRIGKGLRTAPRDAMISLSNRPAIMAGAFGVHRALDAAGALLGPILAFVLITQMPAFFDVLWVTSFVFAILGLAVLLLFVQNPKHAGTVHPWAGWQGFSAVFRIPGFWRLTIIGAGLAAVTVSDGFLYLLLQRRSDLNIGFFPLFYVVTACCYMLLAVPVGRIADRCGRGLTFMAGYVALGAIYLVFLTVPGTSFGGNILCLLLLGLHYAATQGVLMAIASDVIPASLRSSGLALLATLIGAGKLVSSLLFGWIWQTWDALIAIGVFGGGLVFALPLGAFWLRKVYPSRAE